MTKLRILVVDDDPLVCETVKAMLLHDGHSVETCLTGAGALHRFNAGHFDLVVAEHWLHGLSGGEFALTIKNQVAPCPVIVMASHLPSHHPPGVDAVLIKPFSLLQLRIAIHDVMVDWAQVA